MPNKKQKLVKALDDWLPSFPEGKVEVSLHSDPDGSFRVAVWGEDDHGMEKVFKSKSEAKETYDRLNTVSHAALKGMGFVTA